MREKQVQTPRPVAKGCVPHAAAGISLYPMMQAMVKQDVLYSLWRSMVSRDPPAACGAPCQSGCMPGRGCDPDMGLLTGPPPARDLCWSSSWRTVCHGRTPSWIRQRTRRMEWQRQCVVNRL